MNRRTFLSGLAAALVAANTVLGFKDKEFRGEFPGYDHIEDYVDLGYARTWNWVLTDDEIQRYHKGLSLPDADILGYWSNDG